MGAALALVLGALKFGKLGGTVLTMLVSLAAYAAVFGWRYAAGFVGLLLVHEMGHFLAARQRGLPVNAPTFIPFVGAWVELKDQPMDVETEAYVAAAGPLVGTLGTLAVYWWGRETGSELLLAIAYSGFFLNFFNLIPVPPLDGGRMTAILSPRIWFVGTPVMLALLLYRPNPLLAVIAILALPALRKAWTYDRAAPENQAYYAVSMQLKLEYGLFYLGLTAFLVLMTDGTHQLIQPGTG